jgi:hypothetical protein
MGLQHVGALGPYPRTNLVESTQQMIGAVVRESGTGDTYEPGLPSRRGACVEDGLYILRSGRDDYVVVPELA